LNAFIDCFILSIDQEILIDFIDLLID